MAEVQAVTESGFDVCACREFAIALTSRSSHAVLRGVEVERTLNKSSSCRCSRVQPACLFMPHELSSLCEIHRLFFIT